MQRMFKTPSAFSAYLFDIHKFDLLFVRNDVILGLYQRQHRPRHYAHAVRIHWFSSGLSFDVVTFDCIGSRTLANELLWHCWILANDLASQLPSRAKEWSCAA